MLVTELTRDYFKVMRHGRRAVPVRKQQESGVVVAWCVAVCFLLVVSSLISSLLR